MIDTPLIGKEMIWDEHYQFWHRGPGDVYALKEQPSYRALKAAGEGHVVMDVGGHIGCFTRYALEELGATEVYAYEPDPNNTRVYEANFGDNPHVYLFKGAVGPEEGTLDLYLSKTFPGKNRTDRAVKGRDHITVPVRDFYEELWSVQPGILKVDIEGMEYKLDFSMPFSVRGMAIEYHQFDPGMLEGQRRIHQQMLEQGFAAILPPKNKVTFQKITTAVYIR